MWSHLKRPNDETKMIKKSLESLREKEHSSIRISRHKSCILRKERGEGRAITWESQLHRERTKYVCMCVCVWVRERGCSSHIFTHMTQRRDEEGGTCTTTTATTTRASTATTYWRANFTLRRLGSRPLGCLAYHLQAETRQNSHAIVVVAVVKTFASERAATTTTIWCQRLIIIISLCSSHSERIKLLHTIGSLKSATGGKNSQFKNKKLNLSKC